MTTAELAERFLRALETRDVDQVMPLWNDDGAMEFPYVPEGSPNRFEGAEAIRTTLASAFIQRTKMRFFDVTAYQAKDPDLAFVEFRGDMTLQSGAPYNNTYIAKAEARDGKLVSFKEFFNPLVDLAAGNPVSVKPGKSVMDLQLTGKRALVTGSSGGIGAAIAKQLAAEGARVVIHGRSEAKAQAVAEEIAADSGNAVVALGDLGDDAAAAAVVEHCVAELGGLDIVVCNAGYDAEARTWPDIPPADWLEIYNTNVVSGVRIVRPLLQRMREAGWGRVVFISSGVATQLLADQPNYAASKAALVNMAVGLSKHMKDTGVTVNTISPGFIVTPGGKERLMETGRALGWSDDWETIEKRFRTELLPNNSGRSGTPEDVAALTAFVCSPLADYVNGANLRVDGGSTLSIN